MTESELLGKANQWASRISGFHLPEPVRSSIRELRQMAQWGDWAPAPGVYYFAYRGEVVYVGRALPSVKVGNRVGTHIDEYSNPAWAEVIRNDDTVVGIWTFPLDDWHWLAALEVWLIDKPRPKFNMRF
jgi:hypothetical protein